MPVQVASHFGAAGGRRWQHLLSVSVVKASSCVAQSVERSTKNGEVGGSSPPAAGYGRHRKAERFAVRWVGVGRRVSTLVLGCVAFRCEAV